MTVNRASPYVECSHQLYTCALPAETSQTFVTNKMYLSLWRGVVCSASAGEMDTPTQHWQSCLAGIKAVPDCLVVVGM